ncbi:MAG: hypothetical protein KGL16_12335 [Acidobacteriota bacterium]|nr:hypothetical protein [Acidobacteriota bacterium]
MDARPLVRLRWRLRGAWLWPSFVVLTLADGAIVAALPYTGDSASFVYGWLLGVILSLLAIVVLAPPLGAAVRRLRPDMPRVVARDYAGALIVAAVSCALLAAGLVHRQAVAHDHNAAYEAAARAESYIGAHAPRAFMGDISRPAIYPLQSPQLYYVCVAATSGAARHYCVVVDLSKPFGRSVRHAGAESIGLLSQGTG